MLLVERLRKEGHQVQRLVEIAPRGSVDALVLAVANQQGGLLLTNDKDFGEHVFRNLSQTAGVVLLRLAKRSPQDEVETVAQVIQKHGTALLNAFTVIKPQGNVRIRRKP